MLKINIARVVPPRFAAYLLGIIPGLFFESSVAIGEPHLAASVIARAREIYPFGPYGLLIALLASGLFIGQGFLLIAWIADLLIASTFALWQYAVRTTFDSNWLYQRIAKLQGTLPRQNAFIRVLGRVYWPRRHKFFFEARPILKCLYIATKQLLKTRYGIERGFHGEENEWGVWYAVLGKSPKVFQEAPIVSRCFLACGLAGFTALYALPPLRHRYFVALSVVFAFPGLITMVNLARWKFNPVKRSLERLQSVLLELSEAKNTTGKPKSDSNEDSRPTVSAEDEG